MKINKLIENYLKEGQFEFTDGFNNKLKLLLNKLHNRYGYFYDYDINKKFATQELNKFVEEELTKHIKTNRLLQKELNNFISLIFNDETDYKKEEFMDLLDSSSFEKDNFIKDKLNLSLFLILDNKRFRQCLGEYDQKILNNDFSMEDYKKLLKDEIIPKVIKNF